MRGTPLPALPLGGTAGAKRPRLWFSRSGRQPRPLTPELHSLGRGPIALAHLDRQQRPRGGALYEICCVLRGADECRVAERTLRIGPGTLFAAGPQHALSRIETAPLPGELYWLSMYLDIAAGTVGSIIAEALDRHCLRIIRAPQLLLSLFDRLLAEHRIADEHSAWAAQGALRCLLAEVLRAYEMAPRGSGRLAPSDAIAAAIAIIDERLAEPLTISQLAAAVQLSPGKFHSRFLLETGYTPADYGSRQRLAKAKELLVDRGLSITDIAHSLGFSTSQYFATFFRRFTGASPREYRRQFAVG